MRKAIFLDRDGTLIVDKIYLNDVDQIKYLEGAFDGLKILRDLGFSFFVVTNQSGLPRGLVQIENLYKIHRKIKDDFARHGVIISNFYYAPHMTNSDHFSRKPNPGMLKYADYDYGIDFSKSWMIGDRMIDVEAGHRVGCKSVLLKGTEKLDTSLYKGPEFVADNLLEAALFIRESCG
jgi:D-glycero-D-manno-heptose 1,7-bisphosphate phosphatase